MVKVDVESGVLAMEDVGTMLYMMDRAIIGEGAAEPEYLERAFYIMKSLFEQRYSKLRLACFGGDGDA